MDFGPVFSNFNMVLDGLKYTAISSATGLVLAIVVGIILGIGASVRNVFVRTFVSSYVFFFRGTPLIVLLFIAYFGLPQVGLDLSPLVSGIIALGLNSAAYITEVVRSAINSVDKAQYEAAALDGANHVETMAYIIVPQSLRLMVAPATNEAISLVKNSSLLAVIAVAELTRSAQLISGTYFNPFAAYLSVAALYLLITAILTALSRRVEVATRLSSGL